MGIRLVYGLQTGDASYLDIFYPSRRLKEAALAAGIDYAAMIHSPSDPLSRVRDFCSAGQENHVALLRGELPDSLFAFLEAEGIRVVNPATPVTLARDKLASAAFFGSIGAQHPRTISAEPDSGSSPLPLPWPLPLPLPFVAKPRFGKMGRGVALIEGQEQWSEYQAEAAAKGRETIVQEFIDAAIGRDVRFFFADFGKSPVTGWVCVMRSAPGFLSNAHAGGSMVTFAPPLQLQCEAERIFAASGLVYGTVDFLFAKDEGNQFVVCELNANPGFEELERSMKIDVASAIIGSTMAGKERTL
jgi:glutathione synthase/RimK-type ligase-like ATP-grasp enzyme